MPWNRFFSIVLMFVLLPLAAAHGQSPRRVLLLGMKRDHPPGRHEYMAGLRVLAKCLENVPEIKAEVVVADEPWADGPELLKTADAVVLYLGQGAKWIRADARRTAAVQDLARRGGGIVALHSGIMSKDAEDIDLFRDLAGGCHGGPDRRYLVMEGDLRAVDRGHPIVQGVDDLQIHDEFYFKLKFTRAGNLRPLLQVPIEGNLETVAWAYERPDGGRSFGFSGMDPHANWRQPSYRRLAAQAVLWTLKMPVPSAGLPVNVPEELLREPEPPQKSAGDSWSRFRGPNGTGISTATTIPVNWTEKDYNWKVALPGTGSSSPVVWGERVFVTCGDSTTAERTVLCIDAKDGHTVWRQKSPSKPHRQHRDNDYASATPAVDADGLVLTWTDSERVVLLAMDLDGRPLWRRDLGPYITLQGSGGSPILFGDLAVLSNDQEDLSLTPGAKIDPPPAPGKSFLIAVDRKTGETRWQIDRRTTFSGYSTPCLYWPEDGRPDLVFTNTANGITAVDPAAGKVQWEYGEPFLDRTIASPVVAPGLILAGHGAGVRGARLIA
ncbi:MAG: ThuA domain-containing protein, partial [Pirellulales bacterium]|nr:ThuA domain-containing protein [Pirellulales bacterium]